MGTVKIAGARALLPEGAMPADVLVDGGEIVDIGTVGDAPVTIDGRGKLLAPAMVDIHGDAFERQVMPRPKVFFPIEAAVLETDRQLAANGIATAYHALTLSWEPGLRSVPRGEAFVAALDALRPRLTVDNRLQLRWETFAFEAVDLIARALENPAVPSIAFNDHTSMSMRDEAVPLQERLFEHNPRFRIADTDSPAFAAAQDSKAKRAGLSAEAYRDLLLEVWARRPQVLDRIAEVAAMGRAKDAPMLSHDDTQDETRDHYRSIGASITEFPMRVAVAQAARDAGDAIVFGAPNVMRGGSHIGSPGAAEMVEAGLCDALASDYFYPAMLAAVAKLVEDRRATLAQAWSLVSAGPAKALGLDDRGAIAVGKRADLVLIDWPEGAVPAVKLTLSAGRIAYRAEV